MWRVGRFYTRFMCLETRTNIIMVICGHVVLLLLLLLLEFLFISKMLKNSQS